jgi:predicted porin
MKKLLLATLVSAASIGAAQAADVSVYGRLNVSVDSVKNDLIRDRAITLDSNASRFGVKGGDRLNSLDSERILSVVYGIEWGVGAGGATSNTSTDAGGTTTADLSPRNRFIGLDYSDVGAIKFGRLDTNLKVLQEINPAGGIDIFNDYVNGKLDMAQVLTGENRIDNVISLESAKINLGEKAGGLQVNFMIAPSEKTVAKGTTGILNAANATSTSVYYTNKDVGLYTGFAYDVNMNSTWAAIGASRLTETLRWVGSVDLGKMAGVTGLTVNAQVQKSEVARFVSTATTAAPEETSYLVSAIYKFPESVVDGLSAKLQYQTATTKHVNNSITALDVDIDQLGAGLDYAFTTKTKVYGFVAQRTTANENNPIFAANGVDREYKYVALGLGLDHKF